MIITTAGRTNEYMTAYAINIASELESKYVERKKRSVSAIQEIEEGDCIVVGKERLELYPYGEKEPFFFHPNSAMFRIKRIMKGEPDPFIEAASIYSGKTVLDCTLGLASDSIVASFVAGEEGKVTGIEANPFLAYMVNKGLKSWDSEIPIMNEAMNRIEVVNMSSLSYLESLPDNCYDIVYFDPMFEEHILESDGIKALSRFAVYEDITQKLIDEALRVAKDRIVLKDHFRSSRFEKFNFDVIIRKSSKFHFGVIKKLDDQQKGRSI
ncbi:class I SAM-dependent methyltransferase [Bacillus sp. DTU_2020_1000418_1_SI_GHA_SEK_038]|uniref:class I SAM-dependent methyltransferase n=1 Tax=Bacillus sp. DTU_2020_1000418_1_SI_GHA_SEK_038 TaxID=3077585 RepID=UPI0028F0E883|nr:class I SAM-dependent methyltransferase [Bacillus sp. DTU_2020_1000418_1_SI_GHA_SEK_038]WNS73926.1 class I SAM-dependent methyltransferase [Bacillus sp. DTU_2020_1000418_1_SI_GHA_SEK_038]